MHLVRVILKFLSDNKTSIPGWAAFLGVVGGILLVVWRVVKFLIEYWWKSRLRIDVKIFEVITDSNLILPKLFGTENDVSSLADHRINYQPRDPKRDTQAELKAAITESRYLLITAPTGYGKTREAGLLAQNMMLEGWRVVRIKTGWLEKPKELPDELNNNRSRVLIVLDDLNGLFSTGEFTQSPRSEQMLILSQDNYHDRLLKLLDAFEKMCTESEIRVIATARSEAEQWKLLDYDTNDKLWKRFKRVELSEPAVSAIINLLKDEIRKNDIKSNSADFESIAKQSDGTYRNILLNLRRCHAQNKTISKDDFTETLNGSWKEVYESAIKKHPAVKYIYDSIDILRQAGIDLFPFLIEPTALLVWGGNGFQKLFRQQQIRSAITFLTQETKILRQVNGLIRPSDGQIEARSGAENGLA